MEIFHELGKNVRLRHPAITISRGNDGFMLAVSLSARRSSLLGPFPSAFQAEKAGIRLAEEGGVEQLMVVCDWLSCSDDRLAGTMEPARPLH